MSNEFSTVIEMGAKAPFYLVMQLNREERAEFIELVAPSMSEALKQPVIGR